METAPLPLYVGRFAPTPSGPLHRGSLVAALGSYLDAKAHRGLWRLRMDNLDRQRCQTETEQIILDQLAAHGLRPDGPIIRQHARYDSYRLALDTLQRRQAVYRCNCTRNTLRANAAAGRIPSGMAGPIYPGTCRHQPPPDGESAHWRFRVPLEEVQLWDRRLGTFAQHLPDTVGDTILQRADGVFAYHLAEVVDNAEHLITDVVRGADLAPLTPLHHAIHRALYPERPHPRYLHLPVLYDAAGRKLSKTNHAPPLDPRDARDNLIQAAQTLGLCTVRSREDPDEQLDELLRDWTDQWRHLFVAGQQPIDALETPRQ